MKPTSTVKQVLCLIAFTATLLCGISAQSDPLVTKAWVEGSAGSFTSAGSFSKFGFQAILRDKWIASVSHYSASMNIKGTPGDYEPAVSATILLLNIPLSEGKPKQKLHVTQITAGRFIRISRSIFFTGEAGASIIKGDEATFKPQQSITTSDWLGYSSTSNYSTSRESKTAVGGAIEANVLWAFSAVAGIGLGGYANINPIQSHAGIGLKLVIGWMHKGKRNEELNGSFNGTTKSSSNKFKPTLCF